MAWRVAALVGSLIFVCAAPVKTNRLAAGRRHTFSVFAVDSAGNADATPLERSFKIKGA